MNDLFGLIEEWMARHPHAGPDGVVQWMRNVLGYDPFLLFDEEEGMRFWDMISGKPIDDGEGLSPTEESLFEGLCAGP